MSADPRAERMDRVADRLAETLDSALTSLAKLRHSHPLTDGEAVIALSALLTAQGVQLNDGLLYSLVTSIQ